MVLRLAGIVHCESQHNITRTCLDGRGAEKKGKKKGGKEKLRETVALFFLTTFFFGVGESYNGAGMGTWE